MSNKTRIIHVSVIAAPCFGWVSLYRVRDLRGLGCGGAVPGGLPGVGHVSSSKIQCAQSCSVLLLVQGLTSSALAMPLHHRLLCASTMLG